MNGHIALPHQILQRFQEIGLAAALLGAEQRQLSCVLPEVKRVGLEAIKRMQSTSSGRMMLTRRRITHQFPPSVSTH